MLCADRRAFAESVEWERLGDFFLRVRSRPSAVRAYRDAALACLDGDYYDHGTEMLPCRFLRLRFLRMAETAAACFARATHGCAPCWRMIRCSGKDTLC